MIARKAGPAGEGRARAELRSICVFCGSSMGAASHYVDAAQRLADQLLDQNLKLVYGGGTLGLMGILAKQVDAGGGEVLGIIPRSLETKEVIEAVYGELVVVESMGERKALMVRHADGFIAMPGGFGTLDELFEAVTLSQLGLHQKPIGLLNVAGYFDPLLDWIDRAVETGFVRDHHRGLFVTADNPADLLNRMVAHKPPPKFSKWL